MTQQQQPGSQVLRLMGAPVRVLSVTTQDLRLATNVAQVNSLQLMLTVYEGTNIPVSILTGSQTDSEDGWVTLDSFAATSAPNSIIKVFSNPLAFIRWKVTSTVTGSFLISGVGRLT